MSERSIKVREYVSGPGHYEDQEITFEYIYDLWDEGDLPYELAKQVERLEAELEEQHQDLIAETLRANKAEAENERLREAAGTVVEYWCSEESDATAAEIDGAVYNLANALQD